MAAKTMRSRWAQYDDELEDSDQTISAFRRARRSGDGGSGSALPQQPLSASSSSAGRKKPPVKSAFFFETTDEEELSAHGAAGFAADSMRARGAGRSAPQRQYTARIAPPLSGSRASQALVSSGGGAPEPSFPLQHTRLHIGEIQFPVTRSVLWDRRVLADPIDVSVEQVLPRFTVVASVLKQVYQLFRDRLTAKESAGESEVLCYLCGDAASIVAENHVKLTKLAMKQQRKDKWDPNVLWVPVYAIMGKNKALQLSQKQYVSAISSSQQAYTDEKIDALTAKLQPNFLVMSSAVHGAQLDFQLECPAPPILFRFSLIRNLPLLMTPLAASLSRQEFGSAETTRRSGYLTLDRARKAVPVLKTDPLILQQPIVGVWVYGVPLSEEWSKDAVKAQMADPYLYFACLGYISSRTIKERAELSKNTFLVAIYPSGSASQDGQRHVSPLPRFFECSFSDHFDPQNPTPIGLYAQQRSCLVGVSSFSADLEFKLNSSPCKEWENASQQLGMPIAPGSREESVKQLQEDSNGEQVSPSRSDSSFGSVGAGRSSFSWVTFAQNRTEGREDDGVETLRRSVGSTREEDESFQANKQSFSNSKENAAPNSHIHNTESDDDNLHGSQLNHQQRPVPAPRLSLPKESSDLEQRDRSNASTGVRSCCKSQALLTIQHQQILENQQRQLHEMQKQIAHLRRLLDATKSMDTGGNDEFRTSPVVDPEFIQEPSESVEQKFSAVDQSMDEESVFDDQGFARSDFADDEEQDEVVKDDNDHDEDAESSLHLSSISDSSMRSDLSSLSSSLVGKRLKAKFRKSGSGFNQFAQSRGSEAGSVCMERASFHGDDANGMAVDKGPAETRDEERHAQQLHDPAGEANANRTAQDNNARGFQRSEEEKADVSDSDEESQIQESPLEKLLMPEQYMKKNDAFVDHHRGCFTTPTSDLHSFCVPRIKFTNEISSGYPSDSEDEEIRLIEQKYKRLLMS